MDGRLLVLAGLVSLLVLAVSLLLKSQSVKKSGARGSAGKTRGGVVKEGNGGGDLPSCVVLYGTQTNTAEGFARKIATEVKRVFAGELDAEAVDLEDYEEEEKLQEERLVVLCVATYGDGEPTTNAERFVSWLSETTSTRLDGVKYAVFGLGNRTYEHFNSCGRMVDAGMEKLGAERILEIGLGDDDGDIDADFDAWRPKLYKAIREHSGVVDANAGGANESMLSAAPPEPVFRVEVLHRGREVDAPSGSGREQTSPLLASVDVVKELHGASSDRSCLHVEIALGSSGVTYEAGDHVGIFAENGDEEVAAACAAIGMKADTLIVMKRRPGGKQPYSTSPMRLGTAVARHADLLNSPRRDALLMLAESASEPADAARLRRLASPPGSEEYEDFVTKPQRSLLEVLAAFPSCAPVPLEHFFGVIAPPLQPRLYSISSSPLQHPRHVHVTAAVVNERMRSGRIHKGVCTTWLSHARPGVTRVPIFVRRSSFKLPPRELAPAPMNVSAASPVPIIMVGPGTGLAPFRGFLQERQVLMRAPAAAPALKGAGHVNGTLSTSSGSRLGEAMLFFGCRDRRADYIYEEELKAFVAEGVIDELHVAFSREKKEKEYVQHLMLTHMRRVWALIKKGGAVYVCGDAKRMAKDVNRTLHTIAMSCGGMSGTQAEKFFADMHAAGRYLQDVW